MIDVLYINLVELVFVPHVLRVIVFVDPLLNQVSAVQSLSFSIRVFRICLIIMHEFPAAPREHNLYTITIGELDKLQSYIKKNN